MLIAFFSEPHFSLYPRFRDNAVGRIPLHSTGSAKANFISFAALRFGARKEGRVLRVSREKFLCVNKSAARVSGCDR